MTEAIYARAVAIAKPIEPLDTWARQLEYLDAAITPAKLRAAINDYDHLGCAMKYRIAAFRAGDTRVFESELSDPMDPAARRNVRWLVRLSKAIEGGAHAFVALGIGQLVGREGLLAGLASYGFTVERL